MNQHVLADAFCSLGILSYIVAHFSLLRVLMRVNRFLVFLCLLVPGFPFVAFFLRWSEAKKSLWFIALGVLFFVGEALALYCGGSQR